LSKQFVVIGLGRFGGSVTRTLIELGHEVMAIDSNAKRVPEFAPLFNIFIKWTQRMSKCLKSSRFEIVSMLFAAIGEDIQASILTSLILKNLGIKKVTAKSVNDYHSRVLEKLGIYHVVHLDLWL
jgi:trk system potassium uptake protein TrkA